METMEDCRCVTYNDAIGEWETAPECWGDCHDEDCVHDWTFNNEEEREMTCTHCGSKQV